MQIITWGINKVVTIGLLLTVAAATAQAKPKIPFRVTSDPAGATVTLFGTPSLIGNRGHKVLGTTPLETKVPDDWLHPGFVKALSYPLRITVSKPGYITKTITITEVAYLLDVNNAIYNLRRDTWDINLYRAVDFIPDSGPEALTRAPASAPPGPPTPAAVSAAAVRSIAANARPALVLIHAGGAYGTGFFITDNGVIVTARGVVGASTTATVTTNQGQTLQSESVYISPDRDLALIKVAGNGYPYARLAGLASIKVGEAVVALGAPTMPISGTGIAQGGIANATPTAGVTPGSLGGPGVAVGAVRAVRETRASGSFVQTSASIYWGNVGGPLINLQGQVVGVNTTDIAALSVAQEAAGGNVPVLRDSPAGDEVNLTYVDTNGHPFEADDSRQTLAASEKFAVSSADVLELLKRQFQVSQ